MTFEFLNEERVQSHICPREKVLRKGCRTRQKLQNLTSLPIYFSSKSDKYFSIWDPMKIKFLNLPEIRNFLNFRKFQKTWDRKCGAKTKQLISVYCTCTSLKVQALNSTNILNSCLFDKYWTICESPKISAKSSTKSATKYFFQNHQQNLLQNHRRNLSTKNLKNPFSEDFSRIRGSLLKILVIDKFRLFDEF